LHFKNAEARFGIVEGDTFHRARECLYGRATFMLARSCSLSHLAAKSTYEAPGEAALSFHRRMAAAQQPPSPEDCSNPIFRNGRSVLACGRLPVMTNPMTQVPTFDALLWPALNALKAMGGSGSNDELLTKVIELEGVPEAVASFIHTDNRQTKLGYNLAWAKTYLKRAGAIENSTRGVWTITDTGEHMTQADAAEVPSQVRRQDYERRRQGQTSPDAPTTEESVAAEASPPEETWKDRLLATLRSMTPDGFERLAQRLLREAGFIKVEVTGRSGDGGIDGQGVLRVALLSFQVLFQCKRYKGSVGSDAVRDFRGAMVGRSDKGLIITTGSFTNDAKREATRDGAPAIDLIDGNNLCDLLHNLKLGVHTEVVERVIIDRKWFESI
jgi:restriction system protein